MNTFQNNQDTIDLLKKCPCGYTKEHHLVRPRCQYTTIGEFLNMFGISYQPIKIRYQCVKCNSYFDETTDPKVLRKFL